MVATDWAGLYVIFEGLDGAGKSTQIAALEAALLDRRRPLLRLAEPSNGPAGREIRRRAREGPPLTLEDELALFITDRRSQIQERVLPALAQGWIVLQDRSFYSTVAYQGARPGAPSQEALMQLNAFAPRPDLVILLDLPAEDGLARVHHRGAADAFEQLEFLQQVRRNFLAIADARFLTLDARQAPDVLTAKILQSINSLIAERGLSCAAD